MEADFCIICNVTIGEDCVMSPADDHLHRLTRLLQMVVEPISDTHVRPCGACENKMSQVEAVLEELRVAYYETRKGPCSSAWTEGVIAADDGLYYTERLTVVQTETIGTQTEDTKHTELIPPDIVESQTEGTPETKVSKSRSLRKSTEPRQIKQEIFAECTTPVNDLTCPVCGDLLKTQGGYRRHLKNHGVETVRPNTPRVKTEESADVEETQTPRRRGRPPGSKAGKKKEENAESEKVDEDMTRAELLRNLQDHIYSELSAPSAYSVQHMDVDDDDAEYNVADDDAEYTVKVQQNKTPRRRYRRRAKSDGVVAGPPFQCETCQKVFKDIYGLERHQEMLHSSNPTERFACDKCDVTFKWKQSLTAHKKLHKDAQPPATGGNDNADENMGNDNEESKVDLEENKTPRRKCRKSVNSEGVVVGRPFECETCQKTFKVRRDLERHQEMVHSSNLTERFACDKCGVTFKWKQSLKAHQKLHMDDDNAEDNMENDNDQNITPRRKRGKSEGVVVGPQFECETCQKIFNVRRDLERHQEMVHSSNPTERFACDKCDVTFKWKQSLTAHKKLHMDAEPPAEGADASAEDLEQKKTPRKKYKKRVKSEGVVDGPPFECETCQKIFKYRQVLVRHQQMVHLSGFIERFPCDQCSLTFKWKQSLKAHLRLHTDARPFVCTLCPKTFRSSGTLRQHTLSHEGTKLYQCHICNLRFTRSMRLQIHLRGHTGELPYVCDQCGKGFADPQIFKRHMREHNGERPYICGECGKGFTMARYLSEHRKGHTGQKEYLCATCGAAFANSGRLRRHMGVHGTKKHACTLCDKTYKYKEALANHMNMHMGLKPHLCSHCGRSFSQRSGLRQHALSHTAQPKPFKCDICAKQFSTAAKVRRHSVLHGVKHVSKGGSQVFEVAVEDVSVDILETHDETYDGTVVLEISNETEPFIPPVAAVEETMEETAAEVSAASQSLLQVLTQQQQANPAPSMHQSSHPPTIQLTSSKLKAHLNRGQRHQATGETVQVVQQVTGETVQVVQQVMGETVQVVQQVTGETVQVVQQVTGETVQVVEQGTGETVQVVEQGTGETVQVVQQGTGETVQVIEYKQEEEGEQQVAAGGTQTIYLQPATSGASPSLGQIYQVVGSGGSILYQIQQ